MKQKYRYTKICECIVEFPELIWLIISKKFLDTKGFNSFNGHVGKIVKQFYFF